MSMKIRIEKLEAEHGGGKINYAVELQKLRDLHRQEEAGYQQMIVDGVSADDVQRIREERERAKMIEKKAECERIIAENSNPELVRLVKRRLRAMDPRI
jgi:hypothetical protein